MRLTNVCVRGRRSKPRESCLLNTGRSPLLNRNLRNSTFFDDMGADCYKCISQQGGLSWIDGP